jgi:hypothetical protein
MNTGPQFNPLHPNETYQERFLRERKEARDARKAEYDANQRDFLNATYENQSSFDQWKAGRDMQRVWGPEGGQTRRVPAYTSSNLGGKWGGPRLIGHRDVRQRDVSQGDPATGGYGGQGPGGFNEWSANRDDYRKALADGEFDNMSPSQREEARMDMSTFREEQAAERYKKQQEMIAAKEKQLREAAEDKENKEIGADPNVYDGPDWDKDRQAASDLDKDDTRFTQEQFMHEDRWNEEDRLAEQRDPRFPFSGMYDEEKLAQGRKDLINQEKNTYDSFLQRGSNKEVRERQARDRGINEAIDDWTEYDNRQVRQPVDEGVAADIAADSSDNFLLDYEGDWQKLGPAHQATRNRGVEDDSYDPPDSGGHDSEEQRTGKFRGPQRQLADPQAPATGLVGAAEWKKEADRVHREKIGTATDKVTAAGEAGHLAPAEVASLISQIRSGRPSAVKDAMWRLHEMGVRGGWIDPILHEDSLQRRPGPMSYGNSPFGGYGDRGHGEGPATPVIPGHGRYGA